MVIRACHVVVPSLAKPFHRDAGSFFPSALFCCFSSLGSDGRPMEDAKVSSFPLTIATVTSPLPLGNLPALPPPLQKHWRQLSTASGNFYVDFCTFLPWLLSNNIVLSLRFWMIPSNNLIRLLINFCNWTDKFRYWHYWSVILCLLLHQSKFLKCIWFAEKLSHIWEYKTTSRMTL